MTIALAALLLATLNPAAAVRDLALAQKVQILKGKGGTVKAANAGSATQAQPGNAAPSAEQEAKARELDRKAADLEAREKAIAERQQELEEKEKAAEAAKKQQAAQHRAVQQQAEQTAAQLGSVNDALAGE